MLNKSFLKMFPISRSGDRAPRFLLDSTQVIIKLNMSHGRDISIYGNIENISSSGILINLNLKKMYKIEKDDIIKLEIFPDNKHINDKIKCEGKVVRKNIIDDDDSSNQISLAISFNI